MSTGAPATWDLEEVERALLHAAQRQEPSYHGLGYAWEALKRAGHVPDPASERAFQEARNALISPTKPQNA